MQPSKEQDAICTMLMQIGEDVANRVVRTLQEKGVEHCAAIYEKSGSDIIYQIDRVAEEVIVDRLQKQAAAFGGILLIAEGIGESEVTVYPKGFPQQDVHWQILLDPIDGTRGFMHDKRPAFFLAGAASNRKKKPRLSDISVAVMVEIPTTRMYLCDSISAVRDCGIKAVRRNILSGERRGYVPQPSSSTTIRGGFAQFARFFSPGKDILARLEEDLLQDLFPDAGDREIVAFEDQYISSGGQLYELLTGKDRFTGDIRNSLYAKYSGKLRTGHVCHPYDLAAHLIGTEAGLIITDVNGDPLDGPFETCFPMDWIGYANEAIFQEVSPVLNCLLKKHNLL